MNINEMILFEILKISLEENKDKTNLIIQFMSDESISLENYISFSIHLHLFYLKLFDNYFHFILNFLQKNEWIVHHIKKNMTLSEQDYKILKWFWEKIICKFFITAFKDFLRLIDYSLDISLFEYFFPILPPEVVFTPGFDIDLFAKQLSGEIPFGPLPYEFEYYLKIMELKAKFFFNRPKVISKDYEIYIKKMLLELKSDKEKWESIFDDDSIKNEDD